MDFLVKIYILNPGEKIQAKSPFGSMLLDKVNSETSFSFLQQPEFFNFVPC
jgi:hypothetical protein